MVVVMMSQTAKIVVKSNKVNEAQEFLFRLQTSSRLSWKTDYLFGMMSSQMPFRLQTSSRMQGKTDCLFGTMMSGSQMPFRLQVVQEVVQEEVVEVDVEVVADLINQSFK